MSSVDGLIIGSSKLMPRIRILLAVWVNSFSSPSSGGLAALWLCESALSDEEPFDPSLAKLDLPENDDPAGVAGVVKSPSTPGTATSMSAEKKISGLGLIASRLRSSAASGSSSMLALLMLGDIMRLPPLPPECAEMMMSEGAAGKS